MANGDVTRNQISQAIAVLIAQRDGLPDGPAKAAIQASITDLQAQRGDVDLAVMAGSAAVITARLAGLQSDLTAAKAGAFDAMFGAVNKALGWMPPKPAATAGNPTAAAPAAPADRDYFARAAGASVQGVLIEHIQTGLNSVIAAPIKVDGDFGPTTERTLRAWQTTTGLPVTGRVSGQCWQRLVAAPAAPPIFDRCLQVTGSFEGTGFDKVVGNFDGAGITWGIIGFTLGGGELGLVLSAIDAKAPGLIDRIFGADAATIRRVTGKATSPNDRIAWANSVSSGQSRYNVIEPWLGYFAALGSDPAVQAVQVGRARDQYWGIALRDAAVFDMHEELDMLLFFDIAVQNGGMGGKDRTALAQAAIEAQNPTTNADKRAIIAHVVSSTADEAYRKDVLDRKMAIATGAGTIHGSQYRFSDWGFQNGFAA